MICTLSEPKQHCLSWNKINPTQYPELASNSHFFFLKQEANPSGLHSYTAHKGKVLNGMSLVRAAMNAENYVPSLRILPDCFLKGGLAPLCLESPFHLTAANPTQLCGRSVEKCVFNMQKGLDLIPSTTKGGQKVLKDNFFSVFCLRFRALSWSWVFKYLLLEL